MTEIFWCKGSMYYWVEHENFIDNIFLETETPSFTPVILLALSVEVEIME
ncbi:UNVERIFIED_CONTAM: hypothetical protein NCL1_54634 [Trichonephila clavipes]